MRSHCQVSTPSWMWPDVQQGPGFGRNHRCKSILHLPPGHQQCVCACPTRPREPLRLNIDEILIDTTISVVQGVMASGKVSLQSAINNMSNKNITHPEDCVAASLSVVKPSDVSVFNHAAIDKWLKGEAKTTAISVRNRVYIEHPWGLISSPLHVCVSGEEASINGVKLVRTTLTFLPQYRDPMYRNQDGTYKSGSAATDAGDFSAGKDAMKWRQLQMEHVQKLFPRGNEPYVFRGGYWELYTLADDDTFLVGNGSYTVKYNGGYEVHYTHKQPAQEGVHHELCCKVILRNSVWDKEDTA
mmetsp:Transcript_30947/g.64210  ORF Transcript_30947/g.64210 Transcript_30947/m.64210 type:complete len:300 (-) Transcript_30947:162-1061(-)